MKASYFIRATALGVCLVLALAPGILLAQTSRPLFLKNHQLYDRGEEIRSLQATFNAFGFIVAPSGAGSPGNETSFFGILTYRALLKFQAANGLPATGYLTFRRDDAPRWHEFMAIAHNAKSARQSRSWNWRFGSTTIALLVPRSGLHMCTMRSKINSSGPIPLLTRGDFFA
jgi:peptidoglycan hydrolase-like protein with peptidoglycan-binding domain